MNWSKALLALSLLPSLGMAQAIPDTAKLDVSFELPKIDTSMTSRMFGQPPQHTVISSAYKFPFIYDLMDITPEARCTLLSLAE